MPVVLPHVVEDCQEDTCQLPVVGQAKNNKLLKTNQPFEDQNEHQKPSHLSCYDSERKGQSSPNLRLPREFQGFQGIRADRRQKPLNIESPNPKPYTLSLKALKP